MKKVIAIITLANAFIPTATRCQHQHHHKPIAIESKIIDLMDGNIDIRKMIGIVRMLKDLQHGKGEHKEGLIPFKGSPITLHALHAIESKHGAENAKAIRASIDAAIKYIKESTVYYRKKLEEHKSQMKSLIRQWSKQRKKEDSPLIKWSESDESVFLKSYAVTTEKVNHFISDLIILVEDVIFSCKQSYAAYRVEEAEKKKHGHKKDEL